MPSTRVFSCPALSVVLFFEYSLCSAPYQSRHKIQPFNGKKRLDTPQMRLVDLDENVGDHRDGVPSLYNRQPGNLHCTSLPSSALVSHPCKMVSFIGPNTALSLTVTTLTYSWFLCLPSPFSVLSSFLSLPSLQSQKQSSFFISRREDGGGIFMHPVLLLHQTLSSIKGTSFPQRNSSTNKKYGELF